MANVAYKTNCLYYLASMTLSADPADKAQIAALDLSCSRWETSFLNP